MPKRLVGGQGTEIPVRASQALDGSEGEQRENAVQENLYWYRCDCEHAGEWGKEAN